MAQIESWFNQDLKEAVKVRYLDGNVFSADNAGNVIGVNVYNNGIPVALAGTVNASVIRADGVTVPVAGNINNNKASVVLPQAAYAVPGVLSVVIKLTYGSEITTLCAVVSNVYQSSTDSVVDPGTIIPSIESLIAAINEAVESIPPDYSDLVNSVYGTTKNLWLNPSYNSGGVTITENPDGSIHVQGTPSEALFIDAYMNESLSLNAYTLSCIKKGTATGNIVVVVRNSTNTAPKMITLGSSEYSKSLAMAYAPYRCEVVLSAGVTYNCDLYVQLEAGTYWTEWMRHGTAVDVEARASALSNYTRNELQTIAHNFKLIYELGYLTEVTKWGHSAGVLVHNGPTVSYSIATAHNGGFFVGSFNASDLVLQNTKVELDITITSGGARIWLYGKQKSTGTDTALVVQSLSNGHNDVYIDFTYYDVYTVLDISKPIYFLITNNGEQIAEFTLTAFRLKSMLTAQDYAPQFSSAFMYQVLDNIVAKIPSPSDNLYLTSPDGNKWVLSVSNSGELSAVSVIPHKSAFIGNSLLSGWSTFGMAATDNQHDYYYYVTDKIHQADNTATFQRLSNGNLEHSTNSSDFNTAWDEVKANLSADTDLICIQLGDNVNTPEKVAQFEGAGGSFDTMVNWIHTNCPHARLVWVGTWYTSIHDWLVNACASYSVQFIDILPLSTNQNKSKLGTIIHRTESHSQTFEGTYTVSGGSLVCSATMYGAVYTFTIPSYTSVVDNGDGTFTVTGEYTVVDSTGVMSHPGDSGMLAIANLILSELGIV